MDNEIIKLVVDELGNEFTIDDQIDIEVNGKSYAFTFYEGETNDYADMYIEIQGEGLQETIAEYNFNSYEQKPSLSDLISSEAVGSVIASYLEKE